PKPTAKISPIAPVREGVGTREVMHKLLSFNLSGAALQAADHNDAKSNDANGANQSLFVAGIVT
ncbi:MAG: hypothetical protein WCJ97_08005, partial [Phycisphaerae bacterium]